MPIIVKCESISSSYLILFFDNMLRNFFGTFLYRICPATLKSHLHLHFRELRMKKNANEKYLSDTNLHICMIIFKMSNAGRND